MMPLSAARLARPFRALATALAPALAAALSVSAAAAQAQVPAQEGAPLKTLRYSFRVAETNFDPAQISDLYSRTVADGIFDAPFEYAFLARPFKRRPNTAVDMPEVTDDYRTFTIRIRPGIYFADDPAFKGQRRELVAQDYVYSIKRHYDPQWKSAQLYLFENAKILGLSELRKEALAAKKPFDYDREVPGVKALDRYTLQVRLADPKPRFPELLSDNSVTGAMAREVVEFYGDRIGEHPVGTGPFRLAEWRRSSRMLLARNPNYRDEFYDEEAPADDPLAQRALKALKGKKLPLVDQVEVSIVEENQPRWLSFLRGDADVLWEVPPDFADLVIPNNELAPNLQKMHLQMVRYPRVEVSVSYFGMENPLVGGYAPEKVALRRAISLAVDVDQEIRLVRHGQAVPAQGVIAPGAFGYEPGFKSEMSEFSRARAKALLDLYGYVDRDGDGWRDLPDGKPLLIEYATQPDQLSRQLVEQWNKNMKAIGIQMTFKAAKWPENLKSSRAGKLMMWGVGWSATTPDANSFLELGFGPNKGQANHARFDLPAFNALYEKQQLMPDGPERAQVMGEANRLMVAYMPYKTHVHRIWTDLAQPWVIGYHRNVFVRSFWKYVDIDSAMLAQKKP